MFALLTHQGRDWEHPAAAGDSQSFPHPSGDGRLRRKPLPSRRAMLQFSTAMLLGLVLSGCYVPLRSPAIPVAQLPDRFRSPYRSVAPKLNLAKLTVPPPIDYLLGPNDTLEVTVPGLFEGAEVRPIRSRIMADGDVTLPLIGNVQIGGMNLSDAQRAIDSAYADGFLVNPRVSVALAEKDTTDVAVIGEVTNPGVHSLPRYQNDVGHALAQAGGMLEFAAEVVEVHRRVSTEEFRTRILGPIEVYPGSECPVEVGAAQAQPVDDSPVVPCGVESGAGPNLVCPPMYEPYYFGDFSDKAEMEVMLRIPLRGGQATITWEDGMVAQRELRPEDVTLQPGDVVVIPRQEDDVFFVVGPLNRTNVVNFTVRAQDRRLGNAFLIPQDRDIDAVTAVAMAGYIDPIDSPSRVILQRQIPGEAPLLVRIDLMKARYSWKENMYVQPGDILYLNPDAQWWFRRTLDRVIPNVLTTPYDQAMGRWIPTP